MTGWNFTAIDPTNTGMALRKEQGLLGPFAEYAPARNTFSQLQGGNGGVDDLRDFLSYTPDGYNYYYDPMVSSEVPLYENISEISSFDQSNTCPSPYYLKERRRYRSLTKPERVANENNYLAHFSAYQKVKDSFDNLDKNTSMSAKDQVRKQVSFHLQEMEKSAYKGYMTVARDSAASKEDLRLWMRRFNNQTGDYLLVEDYIANREYESAKKTLGMMYQKYPMGEAELSDFEKVESIYDELIASEGERLSKEIIKDLVTIADSKEGQACYLARRILSVDYGYFFRPILTELPGMELDGKGTQDADNQEPKIRMLVSPNPTDYDVVFDWSKFETIGRQVRIEITTATGGLIEVLTPASGETSRPWTTKSVSGNICYYRLLVDDKEVDGGQIIINK